MKEHIFNIFFLRNLKKDITVSNFDVSSVMIGLVEAICASV
jgi:hypothetical protein